jgi:hypothetical protein
MTSRRGTAAASRVDGCDAERELEEPEALCIEGPKRLRRAQF